VGRRSRRRAADEAATVQEGDAAGGGRARDRAGGASAGERAADEAAPGEAPPSDPAAQSSRSEAKDAAARAKLAPLAEGERPRAVTVGAIVAVVFAVGNTAAWIAGMEVRGERQPLFPVAVLAGLLLVTAWGMWRARYWAVLGMQALLGITLLIFGLLILLQATPLQALIYLVAVIIPGGVLFWFLVKAMARIQMPKRPERR
jgi:hypothetical protein